MKNILVLGATSGIAVETLRCFVKEGAAFYLVARDQARLSSVADDLRSRGAGSVESVVLDLADTEKHAKLYEEVGEHFDRIDVVYLTYGVLPDQESMEADTPAALETIHVNFNSAVSLLERAAAIMAEQGHGTIAAISSVAGDRVRPGNYIYGCAKAGLSGYLSGLRGRLHRKDISVLTVLPGPTKTAMTEGMDRQGFMWAEPDKIGAAIHKAILKGRDKIYSPWHWRWIMFIIRHLPEFIFKRMKV